MWHKNDARYTWLRYNERCSSNESQRTSIRGLFPAEDLERAVRVLAIRVASGLEQVERPDEPVDEALVLEPSQHFLLVLLLEGVRITDEHGDGVLDPVADDRPLVLRIAEGVFTLWTEFVDPD